MKKIFSIIVVLFLFSEAMNGQQIQTVLDGAYVPEHNITRRVVPYPNLRQADVMWTRRIWQRIDLRQKMNHSLYFPLQEINDRKSLFALIRDGILEGQITAYNPQGPFGYDDEFMVPMTVSAVDSLLKPRIAIDSLDDEGNVVGTKTVIEELKPDKVLSYEIKEDWIFDKQRSERYVRIIGIAPVTQKKIGSTVLPPSPLFWLYFLECRYLFANADVFNLHNNSQPITFDDLFQKRLFASYVIKEENVYDRKIEDYFPAGDFRAILESERIKNDLFTFEHDLWHY
jgi:gliding motility associated protien GldN